MTFRRRIWEECGLLWWAKGYKLDAAGAAFAQHFGEKAGYGRSTLGDKAKTEEEAPREVVDFVWSEELFPLLPGSSRRKYEVVKRGLEADDPVDLAELAREAARAAIVQKSEVEPTLDAVQAELAGLTGRIGALPDLVEGSSAKLDEIQRTVDGASRSLDARMDEIRNAVDGIRSMVNGASRSLDARMDEVRNTVDGVRSAVDGVRSAVDGVRSAVDGAHRSLGTCMDEVQSAVDGVQKQVGPAVDRTKGKLDRLFNLGLVNAGLLAVGIPALFILHCHSVATTSQPVAPTVNVNVGVGASAGQPGAAEGSDLYGTKRPTVSGNMGGKKSRPMPHHPLPHQGVAPCTGSARTLYGSCWMLTGDKAPCPPDQYEEGDQCYIPLTEDAKNPVGAEMDTPH